MEEKNTMDLRIEQNLRDRVIRITGGNIPNDSYEIRMIRNNRPAGLLPFQIEEDGDKTAVVYSIEGLRSIQAISTESHIENLYKVIFSLERLEETLISYMISPDGILMNPETVFLKKNDEKAFFCYYPGKTESFRQSFKVFMEWFIKQMSPAEEEDVLVVYRIYQRCREPDFMMRDAAGIWREEKLKQKETEEEWFLPQIINGSEHMEEPDENKQILNEIGIFTPQEDNGYSRWKKRNIPQIYEDADKEILKEPPSEDEAIYERENSSFKEELSKKRDLFISRLAEQNRVEVIILIIMILAVIYLLVR